MWRSVVENTVIPTLKQVQGDGFGISAQKMPDEMLKIVQHDIVYKVVSTLRLGSVTAGSPSSVTADSTTTG